jgi:hypothetical protein
MAAALRRCAIALFISAQLASGFDSAVIAAPFSTDGDGVLLPNGDPLPKLPVTLYGKWQNDNASIAVWRADLSLDGDEFVGKVTFDGTPLYVALSVRGKRVGDVVEFTVRYGKEEVAYFAGHLAGTNLVGTFEGITGERGNWTGMWSTETMIPSDSAN